MCGVTGIAYNFKLNELSCIAEMTAAIQSRGPDDSGSWINHNHGIAFGHRRLSIIDLSKAGHQPMHSASKRYAITYNGEIYNAPELRKDLIAAGAQFIGHSDTEVMLAAFEAWGVIDSVKRFNGQFAFALWDTKFKKLYLAQDRFGEKPLYYGWVNGSLVFGSELKALKRYRTWQPDISSEAINLFLRYSYVPAPLSIYKDIYKMMPGTVLELDGNKNKIQHVYWSAAASAKEAVEKTRSFDSMDEVVVNELHSCLSKSIKQRCLSDVPLGVFLSSGVDSSLVASLMQEQSAGPIKTFTIGFHEKLFNNEAPNAKKIASFLGTDHTEHYVSLKETLEVIPKLSEIYDEPFADSSQIPTYVVSALARKHVKVCLSGDGGDEIFGGYNRYVWADRVYRLFHRFPKLFLFSSKLFSESQLDAISFIANKVSPRFLRLAALGQKTYKAMRSLVLAESNEEFYTNITSAIINPEEFMVENKRLTMNSNVVNNDWKNNDDFIHKMMLADTITYLPGDILTKVDRASMKVGLEVRTPYLDPEVYSFAWSLPLSAKIHKGNSKYLLRKLLARYIPQEFLNQPKVGFGAPIGAWLRGILKDWAESLLDDNKLRRQRRLQPDVVRKYWQEHQSGKKDWSHLLWNILMFQAWLEEHHE